MCSQFRVKCSLPTATFSSQVGELLKDSRRINVVLTRARSKLIIVGSRTTLGGTAASPGRGDEMLLPKLMRVLSTNKWILTLPPEAHTLHAFTSQYESATQPQENNREAKSPVAIKKGHFGPKILGCRSMLRDVANDVV
jgi:DNA replication ATP-dependent helicase Dna2